MSAGAILDGKTIVVSGVGPGLGREIAAAAMRDGANVVLGARTESNLKTIADELDAGISLRRQMAGGERVAWATTDIVDAAQCQALVELAVTRFGGVDGLVNCAALDAIFGGVVDAKWDEWQRAFDINIRGTMQMTQAVVPQLRKRGGGSVVFIGSQAMFWSQVPQTAYAASKAALIGAVAHLVRELGPLRIRVNTVVPSWMWGPPVEAYVNRTAKAQGVEPSVVAGQIAAQMPLGEIPTDGDVAEAVVFFLSDRARMVTGQSLLVNAGEYLR